MTRFTIMDDQREMENALRRAKVRKSLQTQVDNGRGFTDELSETTKRPIIQYLPRVGQALVADESLLTCLRA